MHASGEDYSRTGYKPWGEERYLTAAVNTDYRPYRICDYYNARWYDPV